MLRATWHRLYSDFLLPDRLPDYRRLLQLAVENGYELHSIGSYRMAREHDPRPVKRLILRRDVDTDVDTARMLFEIEREFDARASYFFRLSTADAEFMRCIEACGSEVGYHFEEIATVAKERRLRTRPEVEEKLPLIRDRFRQNLLALRRRTGLPLRIAAAHGDMANRVVGVNNQELLDDELRAELGIEGEVYDRGFTPGIRSRISDDSYPRLWNPHDPAGAFERGDRVVYLVMHPRHWRRNVRENFADDLRRLSAGLRFRGWPTPA